MEEEVEKLILRFHRLYYASLANDVNGKIFAAIAMEYSSREIKPELTSFCVAVSNEYFAQNMRNIHTLFELERKLKEYGIEF